MNRSSIKTLLLAAIVVALSMGLWSWQHHRDEQAEFAAEQAQIEAVSRELGRKTCESIDDPDRRAYCLALATDQVQSCDAIGNSDLRSFCRGQVTEDAKQCASIQETGLREQCQAMLTQHAK